MTCRELLVDADQPRMRNSDGLDLWRWPAGSETRNRELNIAGMFTYHTDHSSPRFALLWFGI